MLKWLSLFCRKKRFNQNLNLPWEKKRKLHKNTTCNLRHTNMNGKLCLFKRITKKTYRMRKICFDWHQTLNRCLITTSKYYWGCFAKSWVLFDIFRKYSAHTHNWCGLKIVLNKKGTVWLGWMPQKYIEQIGTHI